MFFEFLDNYSTEILTALISILVALLPIPTILKEITNQFKKQTDETDKIKRSIKNYSLYRDRLKRIEKHITSFPDEKKQQNNSSTSFSNSDTEPIVLNSIFKKDYTITYYSRGNTLFELYEKRRIDKSFKRIAFTLAVIMSVAGTIILFLGIIISLFSRKEVGWITTSSGAIIEIVAGIYFWLVNRTMKEVRDNSKQLEKTEDLLTSIELAEKIKDEKIRDETYKEMIDKLLPKSEK